MLRRPGAASEICTRGLLHGKQVCCCYTIAAWSPLPDLRRALRGTEPPRRSLRLGGRWSPGRELNPVFAFIRRTCSHYNTGQRLTGQLRVSAFAPIALHPQRDPAFTTQAGHAAGLGTTPLTQSTDHSGGADGDRTRRFLLDREVLSLARSSAVVGEDGLAPSATWSQARCARYLHLSPVVPAEGLEPPTLRM